jgi:type II secretory pathway pseudopilin PulG
MVRPMQAGSMDNKQATQGFTYIGILIFMAIAGIAMAGTGHVWQQQKQRMNEKYLLEIGEQYRLAIGRFYESTPGVIKQYPTSLEQLLEDRRFPVIKRHLRKPFYDPFYPTEPVKLVLVNQQIVGVYSQSKKAPIRKTQFNEWQKDFQKAKQYSEWRFIYEPKTLPQLEQQAFK